MNRLFVTILALCVAVALAGCKTVGGFGQGSSPVAEVQGLLDQGDAAAASAAYGANQEAFRQDPEKSEPTATALAQAVEALLAPRAARVESMLHAVRWPTAPDAWPQVKQALREADAFQEEIRKHAILDEPRFRPGFARNIESAATALRASMRDSGPDQLALYPLLSAPDFFAAYPVSLDAAGLLARAVAGDGLAGLLKDATEQGYAHFHATYGPYLSPKDQDRFAVLLFRRLAKAEEGKKPTLANIVSALKKMRELGVGMETAPDSGITFVEVTSPQLNKEKQIDFPVAFLADIPFEFEKSTTLDMRMPGDATQGADDEITDILVVINIALAKAGREAANMERVRSYQQVGVREVPNPDYQAAKYAVDMAAMEMQNARSNAQQQQMQRKQLEMQRRQMEMQQQMYNNLAPLGSQVFTPPPIDYGAALDPMVEALQVRQAQDNYQKAVENLKKTPMVLQEPVYAPYAYSRAIIDSTKTTTVHYHIIDKRAGTHFQDTVDVVEQHSFLVAYNVSAADPNKGQILQNCVTEKDVDRFEKDPVEIPLSAMMDHYVDNQDKVGPMISVQELHDRILAARNQALDAYKATKYEATVENDARFESVVVMYVGDRSQGSGFFVTDDLILTNYHVVENMKFVEMVLFNKQDTFGKVVAYDARQDLALVKSQTKGKPVKFYTRNKLPVGAAVEVIGAPQGFEFSITRGIVSAVRKYPSVMLKTGKDVLFVQIDAATSPGNSGGPVFMGDQVISVVDWGDAQDGSENLNFSIHYSEVMEFLKRHDVAYHKGD